MEKLKKHVGNFFKPTPLIHKIVGRFVSAIVLVLGYMLSDGYFDKNQLLKYGVIGLMFIFTGQAGYHGYKTVKDDEIKH